MAIRSSSDARLGPVERMHARCHRIRSHALHKLEGVQPGRRAQLEQNRDRIQGSMIDGVMPEFDSISGGAYPVSRSMYFYVKSAHTGVIPGIEEFIAAFMDEEASGTYGYLTDKGLIPLDDTEREAVLEAALARTPLILPDK